MGLRSLITTYDICDRFALKAASQMVVNYLALGVLSIAKHHGILGKKETLSARPIKHREYRKRIHQ